MFHTLYLVMFRLEVEGMGGDYQLTCESGGVRQPVVLRERRGRSGSRGRRLHLGRRRTLVLVVLDGAGHVPAVVRSSGPAAQLQHNTHTPFRTTEAAGRWYI